MPDTDEGATDSTGFRGTAESDYGTRSGDELEGSTEPIQYEGIYPSVLHLLYTNIPLPTGKKGGTEPNGPGRAAEPNGSTGSGEAAELNAGTGSRGTAESDIMAQGLVTSLKAVQNLYNTKQAHSSQTG